MIRMTHELHASRLGGTLTVTISAPETRNAFRPEMAAAAVEILSTADRDETVRAIVLTGAGGVFSAGMDVHHLTELRVRGESSQIGAVNGLQTLVETLLSSAKPVIAAVEGLAVGSGLAVALACDMIIAGKSARFATANAKIGLTPDSGLPWLLARVLPRQTAIEMLLTGEPIDTQRMYTLGIVNRVVDDGDALLVAQSVAEMIGRMAPNVTTGTKWMAVEACSLSLTEQFENEKRRFADSLYHRNGKEGIEAFLAKRKPQFK